MVEIIKNTKRLGKVVAIVDDEFSYIPNHDIRFSKNNRNAKIYVSVLINGSYILMHRFILGVTDSSLMVDHINRNPLDNRKCNLRIATRSQNGANRDSSKKGTSKYLGVSRHKIGWRVQLTKNGKTYKYGTYKTEEEAAKVYNDKAKIMHGEYANLNILPCTFENP